MDQPRILWGIAAIAEVIGRNYHATQHLLETRQIPGRKLNGKWTADREVLLTYLAGAPVQEH